MIQFTETGTILDCNQTILSLGSPLLNILRMTSAVGPDLARRLEQGHVEGANLYEMECNSKDKGLHAFYKSVKKLCGWFGMRVRVCVWMCVDVCVCVMMK